jgi:branched-chain amino acid transport system substrate-binding protein
MMHTQQVWTRRSLLQGAVAASAIVAAPAYVRSATAATPIKIGIPTVITGGYALLGSHVMRTCRLVKKLTDAKGGVLGQPIEFLFQDTQGDPALCVRKCQELVERDHCGILTGVIVSSEAAAILPKLEEWNAIFLSHGNGDGRLTAELFVPRFFRANTSAPMGARALALYLKDAPQKTFIAIASDAAWGRSSNATFEEQMKKVGKELVDKIYAPVANKDYSPYITKILQSGAEGCYITQVAPYRIPRDGGVSIELITFTLLSESQWLHEAYQLS